MIVETTPLHLSLPQCAACHPQHTSSAPSIHYPWHMYELLVWLLGTCLGISISICIFNNCQLWRTHCSIAPAMARDICIRKSVTRVRNICLHNDKLTLMPSKPPQHQPQPPGRATSTSTSTSQTTIAASQVGKVYAMHFVWPLFVVVVVAVVGCIQFA